MTTPITKDMKTISFDGGQTVYQIIDDTAVHPEDIVSTYNPTGTSPINGTGVADALSSISGLVVDQTYSASSTNAQSGTAVASALSSISGGTSDHAELSNLDFANSGHIGFMSNEDYLPNGTIITVGADKQFQTIQSAYNSIEGKWSNGTVTIKIDDGTYNELLYFAKMFNIPSLVITGTTKAGTIISPTFASEWQTGWMFINQKNVTIQNLTFQGAGDKNETGIASTQFTNLTINSVLIKNSHYASLLASSCGNVFITGSGIDIENTSTMQNGILSNLGGKVNGLWGVHIGITKCTNGIRAEFSGTNTFNSVRYTYTDVTTPWSPTLNSTAAATNAWNTNRT